MPTPEITIAGRKIGPAHLPLVVAEIGINHEGSLDVAKEMVDAAARAGVEVVKHQTHIVEDEMSGAARKVVPGNATVSIYAAGGRRGELKTYAVLPRRRGPAAAHECAGVQDWQRRVQ